MSSREWILERTRQHGLAPAALPELTHFDAPPGPLPDRFAASLSRMGGRVEPIPPGMPIDVFVGQLFPQADVIASATPECAGTRDVRDGHDPRALDDVDVAVVRAAFGVAETGSVWLSENELAVNALAFLAQHLVVLLDPADIVPGIADAYRDARFHTARYAVLLTGPSATADIEGVLVRGAQGVRSLTVVPVPRPAEP